MCEITRALEAVAAGEASSDDLLPLVYASLRDLARARLRGEAAGHTLQATALVHEAYVRLSARDDWRNRHHFFATAAKAMRDILVDHARRKNAAKRGGGVRPLPLDDLGAVIEPPDEHVLDVHEAVQRLEAEDPRKGTIVNLRYFAGLSVAETADAMGLSVGTIEREWRYIRTWLRAEIGSEPA